jgi:CDGSH-type Zn-finger protein/uncharacterized Fe-S cluster protein YjdI
MDEPDIKVQNREALVYLLTEAAEVEHNLMCCYLYAAFSLKTEADGLSPEVAREIISWKRAISRVAVEEMTHLALVNNLLMAIGAAPHFGRPNFPIAPGYHPSGLVVGLRRFDAETLDHFIFLERPEGIADKDGASFAKQVNSSYQRKAAAPRFMPLAQDYLTVGHFYRSIRKGFESLANEMGEGRLFSGDSATQVTYSLVSLPGLEVVTDLKSALAAIDTIVEQGEGSSADTEHSHYRRFLGVRESYRAMMKTSPGFDPARSVAENPVMRNPPDPNGKLYVDDPVAAKTLDFGNALYSTMLRCLAQGFADNDVSRKRRFLDAGIDCMFALVPAAERLTQLQASTTVPKVTAGLTFTVLRDVAALPSSEKAIDFLAERLNLLAQGASDSLDDADLAKDVAQRLQDIAAKLEGRNAAAADPVEVAEGKDIVISFNSKRCIHARFCVLGEPAVFKANVVGAWLSPDEATHKENLVAVARACPSGAITYRRKDGGPEEGAPPVNLVQVRENGPLAIRADLALDGGAAGFRATLCRCGASKNKPYCDGSHNQIAFKASGEPEVKQLVALDVRNGPLQIKPQTDGPLMVSGNMEMISGTGRSFHKTTSAALCRCGASANKPFCDGSHARAGFKS